MSEIGLGAKIPCPHCGTVVKLETRYLGFPPEVEGGHQILRLPIGEYGLSSQIKMVVCDKPDPRKTGGVSNRARASPQLVCSYSAEKLRNRLAESGR